MWKKIGIAGLLVLLLCGLVACNNKGNGDKTNNDTVINSKVLIAYFSATGRTKSVAETISEVTGGNLYEIIPSIPYSQQDLNYNNDDSRASTEQRNPNSRPSINGDVEAMEGYEVVFIGYPIWHGQAPRIISTFIESYDFSGKKNYTVLHLKF